MAEFQNTIDLLGDDVFLGSLIDKSITEINDDVVTWVGDRRLCRCEKLISVNFPSVEQLSEFAISDCGKLESVRLPSIKNMWNYALGFNPALISVTLPATPPTITTKTFDSSNSACVFHIPAGSLSAYQAATNWSALTGKYTFKEDA